MGQNPSAADAQGIDVYRLRYAYVLVGGLLLVFIVRYRSRGRPREVDGAQVHGHTNLELAWTAAPVVILASAKL